MSRSSKLRFGVTKFCDQFGRTGAQRQGPRRRKKTPTGSRRVPKKRARKAATSKVRRGKPLFAIGQERLGANGRPLKFTADQKRRLRVGIGSTQGTSRKFREVGDIEAELLALRLPDVPKGDPLTVATTKKRPRIVRRKTGKGKGPARSVGRKRKASTALTVAKKAQKVARALGSEIPGFEATLAILDAIGAFS